MDDGAGETTGDASRALAGGRSHVRTRWLIVLIVALVELALLGAFLGLRDAQHDLVRADDLSLAFVDVQRGFALLEAEAMHAGRLDHPAYLGERAKLERQMRLAGTRLADPSTPPTLRADIEDAQRTLDQIDRAAREAPHDVATVTELARTGQNAAKAAVDRTEQVTRNDLLDESRRAGAAAAVLAVIAGTLAAAGAALAVWLVRRYEQLYSDALGKAHVHATDLAWANRRLEEVDRTRKQFISVLTHELRSPLSVVAAVSETLLTHGDQLEPDQRSQMLRSVTRQTRRQQRMIDDLLSVVQFGQPPAPDITVVDVEATAAQLVRDAEESGMDPLPELQVTGAAFALVDPSHLEQILVNLCSNTSKYGGTHCWARIQRIGDQVVLTVDDDGPGVPEAFVPDLFRAYTQADPGTEDDVHARRRGLGLGLSISRSLAEANGGSLTYSARPRGGARFTLTLRAHTT